MTRRTGGSTARIRLAPTSSKAAFSALTTSVSSIVPSLCRLAASFDRPTAPLGWLSTLCRCAFALAALVCIADATTHRLNIALELAKHNDVYEDIASKFLEHFLFISDAMNFKGSGNDNSSLWNDEEGLFCDVISWGPGSSRQLPIHSLVSLMPLYATLTLEPGVLQRFPSFKKRLDWFLEHRAELAGRNITNMRGALALPL